MIVDTDVLIDVMQGDSKVTRKIAVLEEEGTPLAISTVSLFELFHGLERVQDTKQRRQRIETVLDGKPTREATPPIMKKAGRIDGQLTANGQAIGMGDTIIAATGIVHEEPVLTRNVNHFERIEGLDVHSY